VNAVCSCAVQGDGTRAALLCPLHAVNDPCATVAQVTGKRRRGSVVRSRCTRCGWSELETAAAFLRGDLSLADVAARKGVEAWTI